MQKLYKNTWLTATNILWNVSKLSISGEVIECFRDRKIQVPIVIFARRYDKQAHAELTKMGACDYITEDNLQTSLLEKTIQTIFECYVQLSEKR